MHSHVVIANDVYQIPYDFVQMHLRNGDVVILFYYLAQVFLERGQIRVLWQKPHAQKVINELLSVFLD